MDAPPLGAGGVGLGAYADSIDSLSPRSRGAESWDEPFAPPAAAVAVSQASHNASKLRLMCSYGGQIVPRPHDRALCYLGGETRIVVVDRHSTIADLHARLSRSLLAGRLFSLKYQLPSEDLDSLISVTTDEDLDNMIEEYDRIAAASSAGGKPARLRLFLFPAKPESPRPSSSSMGSLLDDSKSETWFVDALNNSMLGGGLNSVDSASSSVNCLLGLDDSKPSPDSAGNAGGGREDGGGIPPESENEMAFSRRDSSGKLGGSSRRGGQDTSSAPESPMLGATSSFGSASSAPALSNLPPIRVHPDDRGPDSRIVAAGLEARMVQMNISDLHQKQQEQQVDSDGFSPYPPQFVNAVNHGVPAPTNPTNVSPTEKPNLSRVFSADDDRSDHGGAQRSYPELSQQQQQQQQQQKPNLHDLTLPGDATSGYSSETAMYYQERPPPGSDLKQEIPQYDPNYRLPVQLTEKGYLIQQGPPPPPPVQAVDLLQPPQQQQQSQQQFVQANTHLLHHHASGTVLPINPYYQMAVHPQHQHPQPTHTYNPPIPMYSLPLRSNPAYSLPVQTTLGDTMVAASISSASKPTVTVQSTVLPSAVASPPKPELSGNVYRTGLGTAAPPHSVAQQLPPAQFIHLGDPPPHQYVGYHSMAQPRPQSAMPAAAFGYQYADVTHPQQIYYTHAVPSALHPQYQAVSSGTIVAEVPPAALPQTADTKQAKTS